MQFPLEKTCVKPGTMLIETVLSRDSLYHIFTLHACKDVSACLPIKEEVDHRSSSSSQGGNQGLFLG